jgi:sugar lactone lactonase YvrE
MSTTTMPGQQFLSTEKSVGDLELVATFDGPMLTGVTVSHTGRIFVNFPKWGDEVAYTVAEVRDGQTVAYPNQEINQTNMQDQASTLVSVQSVVVDPADRLWILDTGSIMFQPTELGGPKLVCVDLETDRVVQTVLFPQNVALPTSYVNDVRFDLRRGSAGMAFVTDSSQNGPNGIIVVDLGSGESWRRLHDHPSTKPETLQTFLPLVEGQPFLQRHSDGTVQIGPAMGSDGIAISADGERLFYCPLGSRRLYSVAVDMLIDRSHDEAAVVASIVDEGDRGGASDGLESDADGFIYSTNYEHNAILHRGPDGIWQTIVHDPRLLWPDTLSMATNGYLYVTANQLHRQPRYHQGRDLRQKPYALFRIHVGTLPVLLG